MKIVVLDTGFNKTKVSFQKSNKCENYIWKDAQWQIEESLNTDNLYEHGTMVSQIILENTVDVELIVFKVFEDTLTTREDIVCSALDFISEHIKCDIINMSFGMRSYSNRLESVCKKIVNLGIAIVAAFDNGGAVSYPAAFPFVIGVVGSARCMKPTDFVLVENSIVDFKAKIGKQEARKKGDKSSSFSQGNSMAAPYITSIICNLHLFQKTVEEIKKELKPSAKYIYDFPVRNLEINKFIQIQKAAVFPYNKEVHSIVNFSDLLEFELVDIYDIKYSGNVGRQVNPMKGASYVINNYKNINWDCFDTFIIGHTTELGVLCNADLKKELLEECFLHKKNVFCFDKKGIEPFRSLYNENGMHLWCAEDDANDKPNNMGMLYQLKTPVLMVAGTSTKQGKFTLQLEIRKLFKENGVDIGQLGTEPNARLFGMTDCLPYGYMSSEGLFNNQTMLEIANEKLADIDKENHDIIMLGMQSGFFPLHYYNCGQIEMRQFPLLFASLPDGVILCTNIQDDLNFVKRIIHVIEALVCTKVFLIALYAFDMSYDRIIDVKKNLLTKKQIDDYKMKVKSELNLPVIVTGEPSDEKVLINAIIHHYNKERM